MVLTYSPAQIIRQLLIDLGLGSEVDSQPWPVRASSEAAAPDNCITVYDTQAKDDGRSMTDGEYFIHYGFQVRVRSMEHTPGWLKSDNIRSALATGVYQRVVTVGSTRYYLQCISNIGQVLVLGKEPEISKRSLFTVNAMVPVRQLN